ncbi:hypothetical protein [Flavobacterium succinicans]|uniref:hypothetical protein n=1 Tax=Flavobacterium succinicans TaxID=29536 RepID=UPI000469BDEC|nr:hypothetical protein [Flavobacterium succinicans]
MKNKAFISRILLLILLATMVFQTKHSYSHLLEQLNVVVCHHDSDPSTKQITHAHHYTESCTVCAFSISSFLPVSLLFWDTDTIITIPNEVSFYVASKVVCYSGSLFALRAPPQA